MIEFCGDLDHRLDPGIFLSKKLQAISEVLILLIYLFGVLRHFQLVLWLNSNFKCVHEL